jgi:hypothetical protein
MIVYVKETLGGSLGVEEPHDHLLLRLAGSSPTCRHA